MQRRDFINLGVFGAGISLLSPSASIAGENKNLAGGVYYTEKKPGRWAKKVSGHIPIIEIEGTGSELTVKVTTAHGMDGYEHYIVKHVLLDQNYKYLDEKMFDPMSDKVPASTFTLKNYKGYLHVLSMCNKHDVWLKGVKI